jgi:hypothetical protein
LCCSENEFLRADYISNALKAVNPVVLGFQVERILLATISQSGLDGVRVSKVEYFRGASHLRSIFLTTLSLDSSILYIPEQWNYPRIDAVLVSRLQCQKRKRAGPEYFFQIQFIQITTATICDEKLVNTRSVLVEDSPERALWRRAVPNQSADVRFSLRWLVKGDQVNQIPRLVGRNFKGVTEQVSSIESVNRALQF